MDEYNWKWKWTDIASDAQSRFDMPLLYRVVAESIEKPGLLKWRRHGIGCLQAYLLEDAAQEIRVHIWHPDIARAGIAEHGDVHDHRFTLISSVLVGALEHTEVDIIEDPEGEYRMYEVVHAREDLGARYEVVPGPLRYVMGQPNQAPEWYRLVRRPGIIDAGTAYRFHRGAYHCSKPRGFTITLVTKTDQIAKKARIIAKPEPVHAFEPDDPFDMAPYIERAVEELRTTGAQL